MIAIVIFSETELGGSFTAETYAGPKIVAHRSGALFAPENTMAALDHAIAMNIDMVEIDVQQLKDGELILLHDDSFNRTTGENKKMCIRDSQQTVRNSGNPFKTFQGRCGGVRKELFVWNTWSDLTIYTNHLERITF